MAERKAVIKNADMSEEMQQDAVDCANQAMEFSRSSMFANAAFAPYVHSVRHLKSKII